MILPGRSTWARRRSEALQNGLKDTVLVLFMLFLDLLQGLYTPLVGVAGVSRLSAMSGLRWSGAAALSPVLRVALDADAIPPPGSARFPGAAAAERVEHHAARRHNPNQLFLQVYRLCLVLAPDLRAGTSARLKGPCRGTQGPGGSAI